MLLQQIGPLTDWMPQSLAGEILGVNDSLTLSCPTCLHNIRTSVSIQSPRVPQAAVLVGGLTGLTFKEKEHSNQIILFGPYLDVAIKGKGGV